MKKGNIVNWVFMVALATQVLVGFGLGTQFLIDPQSGFATFEATTYDEDLASSGMVMAILLYLSGGIALLSIIWTYRKNISGSMAGIIVGMQIFVVGVLGFLLFGKAELILMDGARGAIIIISGVLLYRKLRK